MKKKKTQKHMLDPKRFGLTCGVLAAFVLFIVTLISASNGYGAAFLEIFVSIYPGFKITTAGSFVGLIYGFIDGFIGGYIFAWLYNYF